MSHSYGRDDLHRFAIIETGDNAVVIAEGELPLEAKVSGRNVLLDYEGRIPKSKLRLSVEDGESLSGILPGHLPVTMGSIEVRRVSANPSRPPLGATDGP